MFLTEDKLNQDKKLKEEALKLFNEGNTRREMARKLGITRNKIDNLLYDVPGIFKLPPAEIQESIVESYLSNEPIMSIARKHTISSSKLNHILYMNGIEKRRKRIKALDVSFFSKIDTEEKAYWLGFLFADGYNDELTGKMELTLGEQDLKHLELFKETLGSGNKIGKKIIDNKYIAYRLSFSSVEMSADLARHGCVKAKSLILEFPRTVPKKLTHHFIRGYFDGDGCMFVSDKEPFACAVSLVGTESFLIDTINEMGLKKNKINTKGKACSVIYGGRQQCKRIENYLYKEATIYLERKKQKFNLL